MHTTAKNSEKRKRVRPLQKWAELGKASCDFLVEQRDERSLAVHKCDIIEFCERINDDFLAASVWEKEAFFRRWKRQYGLTYRKISGASQILPQHYETLILEFRQKLWRMFQQTKYTHILVLDETSAPFEPLGRTSLERIGAKKDSIRTTNQEKVTATVMLATYLVTSTGICTKLPLQIIFSCQSSGKFVKQQVTQIENELNVDGCHIKACVTESGWQNEDTFKDYLQEVCQFVSWEQNSMVC